jgi:hypothetical protein
MRAVRVRAFGPVESHVVERPPDQARSSALRTAR